MKPLYEKPKKHSKTKPGTVPHAKKKGWTPSTRNRPAKGYNPVTKEWTNKKEK